MTPVYQQKEIELLSVRDSQEDCNDKMKKTVRLLYHEAEKLEAVLQNLLL